MNQWNDMTEEELLSFIDQIEQQELIPAPPDLEDRILQKLEQDCISFPTTKRNSKQQNYPLYCFKVMAAMAASIVLLFSIPYLKEQLIVSEIPSKEALLSAIPIKSKNEVLSGVSESQFLKKLGESQKWKEFHENHE